MTDRAPRRVDANVILRYLTREPPDQAAAARRLMEAVVAGELALLIEDVILAEVAWTLRSFYRLDRAAIADALDEMLSVDGIVPADPSLRDAIAIYRDRNVKLVDALLAAKALGNGEAELWSFDRDFDRIPGVLRLEPGAG